MLLVAVAGCAADAPPRHAPAATFATAAAVERHGVRVTLAIDGAPLEIGTPRVVTARAENVGPDDAVYGTNDCGFAIEAYYRVGGDWNAVGVQQVGTAAEFKELALRGDSIAGAGARRFLTPERFVGVDSWGCGDVLLERTLPAGAVLEERSQWDAFPDTSAGPIELAAVFGFLRRKGDPESGDDRRIAVSLPSAIVGGPAPDRIGPVEAVDTALADESFAAFLASAPRNTWINPTLDLDEDDGIWRVGLFVNRGQADPQAYGEVAIDAATGVVIIGRFDRPSR